MIYTYIIDRNVERLYTEEDELNVPLGLTPTPNPFVYIFRTTG